MPTVSGEVELDFDLEDYEDDIKDRYCYCDCLINNNESELKEYLQEMYKNLYIYPESTRKIKTMEEIYDDLNRILEGE